MQKRHPVDMLFDKLQEISLYLDGVNLLTEVYRPRLGMGWQDCRETR